MSPEIYYCIPAYNEEENITRCLASLAEQNIDADVKTLIGLSECTDNTENEIYAAADQYPSLDINIIHSDKGKTRAQNEIIRYIENRNAPLLFVDADITLDEKCVDILYKELCNMDQLIVVGGWPTPIKPEGMSLWENFLYNTLHARALYPEAEISKKDVSEFKNYVKTNPQPNVSTDFESKSKIYFHGRIFMMRNADFFQMPEARDAIDDTFLPNMIHTKFGPGTIRTRYDALAYYKPYLSLKEHFKTYHRIYSDLSHIDKHFEEFKYSRSMEETKLDWKFIRSKGASVTLKFLTYSLISNLEECFYNVLPKRSAFEIWQREKIERSKYVQDDRFNTHANNDVGDLSLE